MFCNTFWFFLKVFYCSQEAVLLTMALRLLCMMGAGRQVRAVRGTQTIQTHHHGKKQSETISAINAVKQSHIPQLQLIFHLFSGPMMNTSSPMTMSPLHLLRVMVVHPTLRLLATQKCPLHRSTLSTTLRLLGLLPCESY